MAEKVKSLIHIGVIGIFETTDLLYEEDYHYRRWAAQDVQHRINAQEICRRGKFNQQGN